MKKASLLVLLLAGWQGQAAAGGPLFVGGPTLGVEGQPFTWDVSAPIKYTVDGGPLAATAQGVIVVDHTAGVNRVNAMFGAWQGVATAKIAFTNDGAIRGLFTNGDVKTLADFNAVSGSCDSGAQSPVIFDADGSILKALNIDSDVIGFAGPCAPPVGTHFVTASVFLNGAFQDGVSANGELTPAHFDEAIIHEIGHFSGLGHSQINVNVLNGGCSADDRAGLPLMFPFATCSSRQSLGFSITSPDDAAWISFLYPGATFAANYGFIQGEVRFSDGITPVQGVNVIARRVDDSSTTVDESKTTAVSAVSGYLFTDGPGQSVSGDNQAGSAFGSRAPNREGYFQIPVPPGQWTVQLESISAEFTGLSSVGPLNPAVPSPGTAAPQTVTVTPGPVTPASTINFILVNTPPRFDHFEDESKLIRPALLRREEAQG